MGKIYKGWELMKGIAEGEIKKETKFKDKDGKKVVWNGYNFIFVEIEEHYMRIINEIDFLNSTFEAIEDEKGIDEIKELYINKDIKLVGKDTIESWTGRNLDITFANKINEVLQAVKQIDKRVKKLED